MHLLIRFLFIFLFCYAVPMGLHAQNGYQDKSDKDTVVELSPTVEPTVVDSVVHVQESNPITTVTAKGAFDDIGNEKSTSVQQRKLNDSVVNKLKEGDEFWYVNASDKPKEPTKNFWDKLWQITGQKGFRYGTWIFLALLFLGAVILYLRENQIGFFAAASKKISRDSLDVDEAPENIFETNFDEALDKAIELKNYRLGIRLLFLKTLKALAEKRLIDYGVDKTNFDYVFQLSSSSFSNDFITITRHYEYVWYGKFDVNQNQFTIIRSGVDHLLKQLA